MGVPLSPEPEVRSHREPIRSVRRRGVVPWETMLPTRLLPSLLADLVLDGVPEGLAGQGGEVVVGQVLQLQLVGGALQAGGVGGGDHRVGQLPDLAHRVLEGAVAVDHNLHMLAGLGEHLGLDGLHQVLAGAGEQLHLVLGGLVGAQQAVGLVAAAAVDGGGHDVVQGETFSAPAAWSRRLVRLRVWMSQARTVLV